MWSKFFEKLIKRLDFESKDIYIYTFEFIHELLSEKTADSSEAVLSFIKLIFSGKRVRERAKMLSVFYRPLAVMSLTPSPSP